MKVFKISKDLEARCEYKNRRNGFKHEGTLFLNGREVAFAEHTYINRTWESYEFQSVLFNLYDNVDCLNAGELKQMREFIKNYKEDTGLGGLGMIMAMGDIIAGDSQKEKNDWKTRMLKAGLEGKGLIMPDDWDELSEDDKEERLNKVSKEFLK